MTDALLPPVEPGPEPDTTDAAEPDDVDAAPEAEDAPALLHEDGSVDEEH